MGFAYVFGVALVVGVAVVDVVKVCVSKLGLKNGFCIFRALEKVLKNVL